MLAEVRPKRSAARQIPKKMPLSKTILLIAETFFPDRSVSAIRVTEWCRHLPEFGWKPIVLCRYFGASASQEELAAAVHSEVEVYYLDRPNVASPDGNAGLRQSTIRRWSPVWIGKMLSKELSAPDPQIGFWRCAAHAQGARNGGPPAAESGTYHQPAALDS